MKKMKLLTPILSLGIVSTTLAPLASCSCNATSPVTLDKTLTDKGYSVKSYKLEYLHDSFIELNTPNDKDIEDVEVKVGDITLTKGDHLRIDGKTIWIEGYYMVASTVTINSITLVKKVTDVTVSYKQDWVRAEVMKASDIEVKLLYDDDSQSDPLVWKTGYKIYKGESEISDFDTTGYTFTKDDATAGTVTFKVVYVEDDTFTKSFNVNVTMGPAILEDFLEAYKAFYANYDKSSIKYGTMNFDVNGKIKGSDTTKATIDYTSPSKYAVATFDAQTEPETTTDVAGQTYADVKAYLEFYDDDEYTKEYTVGEESITFTVTSKEDPAQYETVTYDKYTYVTNWVNTFPAGQGYEYAQTNLTHINYVVAPSFTIDQATGLVTITDAGSEITGELVIPETLDGVKVIGIADRGCKGAQASTITFAKPDNITYIGSHAFQDCLLKTFVVPNNVKEIKNDTFNWCGYLTDITIGTGVIYISSGAFYQCRSLTSLIIPSNVKRISDYAFYSTGITSVTFESTTSTWAQIGAFATLDVTDPAQNAQNFKDYETSPDPTGTNWGLTGIEVLSNSFNEIPFSEVITACETFEAKGANPTDQDAINLCASLGVTTKPTKTGAQAIIQELIVSNGNNRGYVFINNHYHLFRCIDAMHDDIWDGSQVTGKAALTFEMATLLSDNNGNAMTVLWDVDNNYDFTNSQFRKNLTGGGNGSMQWYDIDGRELSETRTALQMLPTGLQNSIKTVVKEVGTTSSYVVNTYYDKLFPLTYTEMAQSGSEYAKVEGSAYKYWTNHNNNSDRMKKDSNNIWNYYWLSSPESEDKAFVWMVYDDGSIDWEEIKQFTSCVSFAFAI